jgi:calcineurin-like phosphoesterase family protein
VVCGGKDLDFNRSNKLKRHKAPTNPTPSSLMCSIVPKQKSSETNGALIRCIGRTHGCNDGCLNVLLTTITAIFLSPLLLFQCCRSKCARKRLPGQRSNTCYQLCACCGPKKTDFGDIVRQYCIGLVGEEVHEKNKLTFVCLSDTHNRHRDLLKLPPADVLVHTGDFTNCGTYEEVEDFVEWFASQPHQVKIVVPGNHDMMLNESYWNEFWSDWSDEKIETSVAIKLFEQNGIHLLIDQWLDIPVPNSPSNSLISVFGSPWVTKYAGWQTAFNRLPADMKKHWLKVTEQVKDRGGGMDVLLTHMPPKSVGDMEPNGTESGCEYLRNMVEDISPTVHVFGHVHSDAGWGKIICNSNSKRETQCLNAASVCDYYWLRKNPVTFEVSSLHSVSSSREVSIIDDSNSEVKQSLSKKGKSKRSKRSKRSKTPTRKGSK